jgi:hypothetical protein
MTTRDLKTYPEGSAFSGHIARTSAQSQPAWPMPARPGKGSPNVLVLLLDDVGFAQLGCYGSTIRTPHMDRLASRDLLAHPRLPANRAQPPLEWRGNHSGDGDWVSRL